MQSLGRASRRIPITYIRNARHGSSSTSTDPKPKSEEKIYSSERETHFGYETVSEEVKAHKGRVYSFKCSSFKVLFSGHFRLNNLNIALDTKYEISIPIFLSSMLSTTKYKVCTLINL